MSKGTPIIISFVAYPKEFCMKKIHYIQLFHNEFSAIKWIIEVLYAENLLTMWYTGKLLPMWVSDHEIARNAKQTIGLIMQEGRDLDYLINCCNNYEQGIYNEDYYNISIGVKRAQDYIINDEYNPDDYDKYTF